LEGKLAKYMAGLLLGLICIGFVPSIGAQVRPQRVRLSPAAAWRVVVKQVPPEYPEEARKQHIQGSVVVKVNIDKKGNLTSTEVVSGPLALRQAAVDAVRKSKYSGFMLNGEPVEAETQLEVKFTLPK